MATSTCLARLASPYSCPVLMVAALGFLINRNACKAMAQGGVRSRALLYLSDNPVWSPSG